MSIKVKRKRTQKPEIVYRDNRPVSVIIDIDKYQDMVERLEDIEDIKFIEQIKNKSLSFRKLDDFLKEYDQNV
jgi:PHD/YefM family antitoxin component YafN of YafNO toxin-antitoxin module